MLYAVKKPAGLCSTALMHIDAKYHIRCSQTIHFSHDLEVMVHEHVWILDIFILVLVNRDIRNKHPYNVHISQITSIAM